LGIDLSKRYFAKLISEEGELGSGHLLRLAFEWGQGSLDKLHVMAVEERHNFVPEEPPTRTRARAAAAEEVDFASAFARVADSGHGVVAPHLEPSEDPAGGELHFGESDELEGVGGSGGA
jgi:hypothetical protein